MALCQKVVGRYVARKVIPERDAQDVEMAIMEKFLVKKDKIMQAFNGRSSVRTYFIAILNRMCCEVIRSDSRHWYSVNSVECESDEIQDYNLADTALLIRSEVLHLEKLLKSLPKDSAKTLLMAKYYYNIPVHPLEIESWAPGCFNKVSGILKRDNNTSKGELFVRMALAVNLIENRSIKPDAVRMWFNKQMNCLLDALNGQKSAYHTNETLILLFERLPQISKSLVFSGIVFIFLTILANSI